MATLDNIGDHRYLQPIRQRFPSCRRPPYGLRPLSKDPTGRQIPEPIVFPVDIGHHVAELIAPRIEPSPFTPSGFLPFGFGRQPFPRPPAVGKRIIPSDTHDGKIRVNEFGNIFLEHRDLGLFPLGHLHKTGVFRLGDFLEIDKSTSARTPDEQAPHRDLPDHAPW